MDSPTALHEFLAQHRYDILLRTARKIMASSAEASSRGSELTDGLPRYIDEIIGALRRSAGLPDESTLPHASKVAAQHGKMRFRFGFKVTDVVYDYGYICDSITEEALQYHQAISVQEYRVLNQSLDTGIAEAISEYLERRESVVDSEHTSHLGFIAHELRNALNSAMLSFHLLKAANAGVFGRTAEILENSQQRLRCLIERMVTDVRLKSASFHAQPIRLQQLLEEIEAAYSLAARAQHVSLTLHVDSDVTMEGDRQLLTSAVGNLVQNAIKFTRVDGAVILRGGVLANERVVIEVADQCGGLRCETPDELFRPFEQRNEDRSGLGLGLAITRQAVEAHAGTISARNQGNDGCTFTIELPQRADGTSPRSEQPPELAVIEHLPDPQADGA